MVLPCVISAHFRSYCENLAGFSRVRVLYPVVPEWIAEHLVQSASLQHSVGPLETVWNMLLSMHFLQTSGGTCACRLLLLRYINRFALLL